MGLGAARAQTARTYAPDPDRAAAERFVDAFMQNRKKPAAERRPELDKAYLLSNGWAEGNLIVDAYGPDALYATSNFPKAADYIKKGDTIGRDGKPLVRPRTGIGHGGWSKEAGYFPAVMRPEEIDSSQTFFTIANGGDQGWIVKQELPAPNESQEAYQQRIRDWVAGQHQLVSRPLLNASKTAAENTIRYLVNNPQSPEARDVLKAMGIDPASEPSVAAQTAAAPTPQTATPKAEAAATAAAVRGAPADSTPWYQETPRSMKTPFFEDIPLLQDTPWALTGLGVGGAALTTALILSQQGQQQSDPVAYARMMQASRAY